MKYKQKGGVPKGMRKKTTTYRKPEKEAGRKDKMPTGLNFMTDKQKRKAKKRTIKNVKDIKKAIPKKMGMGGKMIEDSKEVMFGGPTKKMKQAGGITSVKSKRGRGVVTEKSVDGSRSITRKGRVRGKGDKRGFTTRTMTADKKAGTITRNVEKGRGRADGKTTSKTKTKVVGKRRAAKAANRVDRKVAKMNLPKKKMILGGLGRLAGAVKGFRGGKGQGLKARLAGAAKGAAGGGMMGRAVGAMRGMRGAAGQGGGLRGMLKAGAQGAMGGAFGSGAQQNAAEAAAPAEGMEEEMMYGGKRKMKKKGGKKMMYGGMKDRRKKGGLSKRQKTTMKKHGKHHSKKHMKAMTKDMKSGKSFTEAHKRATRKVGK